MTAVQQQEALFDSHCHWDHPKLQALQPELWQACENNGVGHLLVPATKAHNWFDLINLCKQQPNWHLALGLHPYFIAEHHPAHISQLQQLVTTENPVAIGEIGLDWHLPESTWEAQETLFIEQLKLAQQYQLPVILHVRKCHDRVLKLIRQQRFNDGGFVHAFSGNEQQAKAYADLGFKLGVGGTITYQRATKTRHIFSRLPLSWLVLETDAPDMPMSHQTDRLNRPDALTKVLDALTELRVEERTELAQQTTANCFQILKLTSP